MLFIILLLVALFIGWSYIKAKVRKQDSDKFQALRKLADMENLGTMDQAPFPSWQKSYEESQAFVAMLVVDLRRKKVPDSFFLEMWNNRDDRKKLLNLAGIMEGNKCSVNGQAIAVADMIIHNWSNKTPHTEKLIFLNDTHRIEL